MKKTFFFIILIVSIIALSACSGGKTNESEQKTSASAEATSLQPSATPAVFNPNMPTEKVYTKITANPYVNSDYSGPPSMLDPSADTYRPTAPVVINQPYSMDLAKFSSTMTYAQIYNIFMDPESYVGKSIRLRARYAGDELDTGEKMHFLVLSDEMACCQLNIEFMMYDYKGEFPEEDTEILVEGLIDLCNYQGEKFIVLKTNGFEVVKTPSSDGGEG